MQGLHTIPKFGKLRTFIHFFYILPMILCFGLWTCLSNMRSSGLLRSV